MQNSISHVGPGPISAFTRMVEPAQLGTYLAIDQAEVLRLRRYAEYWRFYAGRHWSFERDDGDPLITLNYSRRIVDKLAHWTVGRAMAISVPKALRDHTLPIIEEVWGYNRRDELLLEMALMGGITGDCFMLVTYQEPTPQARRINPHTRGQIRLHLLTSEQVFPVWDPLNPRVLVSVRIETLFYDTAQLPDESGDPRDHASRSLSIRRFTQVITADKIVEQYQGHAPTEKPNPLGEIPVVHIRNRIVPGEFYGMSDLDGIVDVNKSINETMTDIGDIVHYHAAPTTVVTGAKVGQLERAPNNIWSGLPADAKVFNLTLGDNLTAALAYLDKLKTAMHELSSVPVHTLGEPQPVSNTSGVALYAQFAPLIETVADKRLPFGLGIGAINYFILRHAELVDPDVVLPNDLCKRCGGRTLSVDGKKKCYQIDPQTFELIDPKDVEVTVVRHHSTGTETVKMPLWQAEAEVALFAPSAWDPVESAPMAPPAPPNAAPAQEPEAPAQEPQASGLQVVSRTTVTSPEGTTRTTEEAPPQAPEPEPVEPQAPPVVITDYPPEPEEVTLRTIEYDPQTGEQVSHRDVTRKIVPTGCKRPQAVNPYLTEVAFVDVIPKDEQAETDMFTKWQLNEWVSPEWVREHQPRIEDPEAEAERVKAYKGKMPGATGAGEPDDDEGPGPGRPAGM